MRDSLMRSVAWFCPAFFDVQWFIIEIGVRAAFKLSVSTHKCLFNSLFELCACSGRLSVITDKAINIVPTNGSGATKGHIGMRGRKGFLQDAFLLLSSSQGQKKALSPTGVNLLRLWDCQNSWPQWDDDLPLQTTLFQFPETHYLKRCRSQLG